MSHIDYILARLAAGDRVKFYHDYYGKQWIELSRGRILPRKERIDLLPEEIRRIKDALRVRSADQGSRKAG